MSLSTSRVVADKRAKVGLTLLGLALLQALPGPLLGLPLLGLLLLQATIKGIRDILEFRMECTPCKCP